MIHTSGTTGAPKAVELTYANHLASAGASAEALGVEPDDRWLCPLPLHHVGGLNVLIRSVINRTAVVLHEGFDADRVRATLEAGEVTLASLVPTMLTRLRAAGLRRAPGLRAIALGGGPIPAGLLDWARDDGHPRGPRLRDDGDVLADRGRQPGPRRCRAWSWRSRPTARSWCAGRWSPAGPWRPTAGCTRATSAGSTTTAGCTCWAASRS